MFEGLEGQRLQQYRVKQFDIAFRRNDVELFEKFSFTDVTPKHFDDSVFDPKNPEYKF